MPGERRGRGFARAGCLSSRELGLGGARARELDLARAWRLAAGPVLAARAAVEVRRGVLEIEVPEAHWRRAIESLAGEIAARVARAAPGLGVERYRLRGAPGQRLAPPEPLPAPASPPPPDAPLDRPPAAIEPSVEPVEARLERLREAYLGAAQRTRRAPSEGCDEP